MRANGRALGESRTGQRCYARCFIFVFVEIKQCRARVYTDMQLYTLIFVRVLAPTIWFLFGDKRQNH